MSEAKGIFTGNRIFTLPLLFGVVWISLQALPVKQVDSHSHVDLNALRQQAGSQAAKLDKSHGSTQGTEGAPEGKSFLESAVNLGWYPKTDRPSQPKDCGYTRQQALASVSSIQVPPIEKLRAHYEDLRNLTADHRECLRQEKQRQGDKALGRRAKRRVWVDLGSRKLDVTKNFMERYPGARDFEKYAFEPNPSFKEYYKSFPDVHYLPYAASIINSTVTLSDNDVGSSVVSSVKGSSKGMEVQTINWVEWLVNNVTPEDFVVVKMDIEFCEFGVLNLMVRSYAITLVDELLLECHFRTRKSRRLVTQSPTDEAPISRTECKNLVHWIDLLGVKAVNWAKKNYWADQYAKTHGGFQAS